MKDIKVKSTIIKPKIKSKTIPKDVYVLLRKEYKEKQIESRTSPSEYAIDEIEKDVKNSSRYILNTGKKYMVSKYKNNIGKQKIKVTDFQDKYKYYTKNQLIKTGGNYRKKAYKKAKEKMQREMIKKAKDVTIKVTKASAKVVAKTAEAISKAIVSLIEWIIALGGGTVLLVIVIFIVIIMAIMLSPLGELILNTDGTETEIYDTIIEFLDGTVEDC